MSDEKWIKVTSGKQVLLFRNSDIACIETIGPKGSLPGWNEEYVAAVSLKGRSDYACLDIQQWTELRQALGL